MDGSRFDTLTRSLPPAWSRRGLTWLLGGLVLGGPLAVLGRAESEAKGKRKKKKRKKQRRKKATACPAERACGSACCPAGDLCVDPFTGLCASGAGTCPPGADVCGEPQDIRNCSRAPGGDPNSSCFCFITIRGFSFCGGTGSCTPVNDPCASDVECVAALQDEGARCVQGPACCGSGGTQCHRPCPT